MACRSKIQNMLYVAHIRSTMSCTRRDTRHDTRRTTRALCTLVPMLLTVCKLQHSPLTLNKLGYLDNTPENVELLDGKISMGDLRRLNPW